MTRSLDSPPSTFGAIGAARLDGRRRESAAAAGWRSPNCARAARDGRASAVRPHGNFGGTPRSVAFNVQGFRIAVNRRHRRNPHPAERPRRRRRPRHQSHAVPRAGRGRRRAGARRDALRRTRWSTAPGASINPTFRDYHVPAFADIPRTEVYFAETSDAVGPFGAKSMSESPYNPVAAALGNALRDATGIRFDTVPFKADRVLLKLAGLDKSNTAAGRMTLAARPRRDAILRTVSGGSSHE